MMAEAGDLTVRIRVIDEATPVLRKISRRLWWMRHGRTLLVFGAGWVGGGVRGLLDGPVTAGGVISLVFGCAFLAYVNWKAGS